MNIKAEYLPRRAGWMAIDVDTYDGGDPASLIGYGHTAPKAVDDLIEQMVEDGKLMQKYIGTKVIHAEAEYAQVKFGAYDEGSPGYRVVYPDGYHSWSPKEVFEEAYRPVNGLNFGLAIEAMKKGKRLERLGWTGNEMFVFLVPGSTFQVSRPPLLGIYPAGTQINYHSHIDMRTASGEIVPWSPSQIDMLADDWRIVEVEDHG